LTVSQAYSDIIEYSPWTVDRSIVLTVSRAHSDVMIVKLKSLIINICKNYWLLPFFFNWSGNKTVISYGILEHSNSSPLVSGIVFWTVALGLWPRAAVQNTVPSTSGQQFDCSQISYEITVYYSSYVINSINISHCRLWFFCLTCIMQCCLQ